jgi:16S rRNA (cytosine967-C5)-methyltransferase
MSARAIAFQVLLQVERADAYLNVALDAALKASGALARQDAALATELCYGVARRRLSLDAAIAAHSNRPIKKLENSVLVALRLGAYQLLYLDRVPVHAAVSESVDLVKRQGLARAAGFVNAVLRHLSVDQKLPLPDEPLSRLSIEGSHPLWLVKRWSERFGLEEAQALCRADNEAPAVCLRVNALRATREEVLETLQKEGVVGRPTPYSPHGIVLEDPGRLSALESFGRGIYQVQDEAAQLVALAAAPRPGMRVLDACAAPGGKACHLAELMGGQGEVFALDVHARKLEKIAEEAKRLGHTNIRLRAADAGRPLPFEKSSFDLILLDAPCTGLGTLRRHPELRYRRSESDVPRMAELQRSLAKNLLEYLKPGGTFAFAVCSTELEEGPLQLAWLTSLGLRLQPLEWPGVDWASLRDPSGGMATFPHRHKADGFFAARLIAPG